MAHKDMVTANLEPVYSVKHFHVETTVFMICPDLNGGLVLIWSQDAGRWILLSKQASCSFFYTRP